MNYAIDPYEVLGVPTDASQSDIEGAYKRLRKKFHPDLFPHGGDDDLWQHANKMFAGIQSAWETIGDAKARARYDAAHGPPELSVYDVEAAEQEVDAGEEAVVRFKVDLVRGRLPDDAELHFGSDDSWLNPLLLRGRESLTSERFFPL